MEKKPLFDNKWVSLYEIDGYVCSTETRCKGKIISILPFRQVKVDENTAIHFLLRKEVTYPWRGMEQVISSITGGVECEDPMDDAVRELEEEAGYCVPKDKMIYLGQSFGAKSSDTVYHYYTCDLTGYPQHEAKGDGSKTEMLSKCGWFSKIDKAEDPLVYVSWFKVFSLLQQAQQEKKQ